MPVVAASLSEEQSTGRIEVSLRSVSNVSAWLDSAARGWHSRKALRLLMTPSHRRQSQRQRRFRYRPEQLTPGLLRCFAVERETRQCRARPRFPGEGRWQAGTQKTDFSSCSGSSSTWLRKLRRVGLRINVTAVHEFDTYCAQSSSRFLDKVAWLKLRLETFSLLFTVSSLNGMFSAVKTRGLKARLSRKGVQDFIRKKIM